MPDLAAHLERALGDRFRVLREIGRGGAGVVFLAEDLKHRRNVALKALDPDVGRSVGGERFLQEILISARLSHPGILPLIDSGDADGVLWYVMRHAAGGSLRDRLDAEGQLAVPEALRIAREVGEALQHAHAAGVVHRDVKPENILFEAGHALVGDFGIARALRGDGGDRLTRTGLSVGTSTYASPEQAMGSGDVGVRTDVYSLACVLYEMLAGAPPWSGPNDRAVLARKLVEPVPGLRVVRETVPPAVEAAVVRALARSPADRFPTMAAFVEALDPTRAAPSATGTRSRAAVSRRWLGAAGVVVLGLAAVPLARRFAAPDVGAAPTSADATFTQLTSEPGVEWFPSLSPDGEWIVYAGEGPEGRDVFLRRSDGQNAQNLTAGHPGDDDQPAISPDGRRIAFRSERDGGGIFVMGLTGEGVRRVTREGFRPAWSPDGTRLAYATENVTLNPQNSDGPSDLAIVDVATGETRALEAGVSAVMPAWSPDGRYLAFTRRLGAPSQGDILTIPVEGGPPVALTDDAHTDWNPVWSPDGRHIYFASGRGGSMNLWRVPVDARTGGPAGAPEPVTTPATSLAHPSLSGDGRDIVYSSVLVTINVQGLPFDPETATVVGDPFWVTTGSRRWSSPDPSPDGRRIAMYSLAQPEGHLYLVNADGSGLRQVTGDAIDRVPRWSPDGEHIAFFSNRGGPLDVWTVRPDGSELRQVTVRYDGAVPAWSPDGSRIAAAHLSDTGANEVALFDPLVRWEGRPAPAVEPPPAELAAFTVNDWSPDGRWLAGGLGFGDAGVIVHDLETGAYERLTERGQWPVWLGDGRRLLFVSGGNTFYVVDRVTKEVRPVFSDRRDVLGPPRLARDGRALYFSRRVTEADLWMARLP